MARIAALVLLVLGLLPIANWIPGGHEAPWYGEQLRTWASGASLVVLLGVAAFVLSRGRPFSNERPPMWERYALRVDAMGWRGDAARGLLAVALALLVAGVVFSARPLLIDEIIQVYQARIFADGKLWLPSPELPEFTSSSHLLDLDGRRFGQFPPGWSAMMVPFALLKSEWIAGPVCFGLAVLAFGRLLRSIEADAATRALAATVFAAAPFAVFLGASHMNHMPTVLLLLVAAIGLSHTVSGTKPGLHWPLLTGLGLGGAALIRPTDAAAFALPTAVWLLWRSVQDRQHVKAMLAAGFGVAVPIALLLAYNALTTGEPLLFGYTALWGPLHGLGFHEAPWGDPHTPLRGLELVNLYLLRLQFHLLELPVPGLMMVAAGLMLAPKLTGFDKWILACSGLLMSAYFTYWHDGYFLGPRFFLPLTPWLVLWVARMPAGLRSHRVSTRVRHALGVALCGAIVWALVADVPVRAIQYANGLQTMRWDPAQALHSSGISGQVLVRESWGAELVARLRGMGFPAQQTEVLYRTQDSCVLQRAVDGVDSLSGSGRDSALSALAQLTDRPVPGLVPVPGAPDTSLRWLPGTVPEPECAARVEEMRTGFTLYAPLLLSRTPEAFVRDLHRHNMVRFEVGTEPEWLLIGDPVGGGGPRLVHIDRDSLRIAWGRRVPGE